MLKTFREATRFADDIKLGPDETLSTFTEDLQEALETYLPFPSESWFVCDISSDWLVVGAYDYTASTLRYFKVQYGRDEIGAFAFAGLVEVEREINITYEPIHAPTDPASMGSPDLGAAEGDPEGMGDAIAHLTTDQRKDLPDAAYALVAKRSKGLAPKRSLPHHINTVKSAAEDGTVDLPRLRNALARASQVKGASRDQIKKAISHLEGHASHLKVGRFAKDALALEDLADIEAIFDRMKQMLTTAEEVDWAEISVLARKAIKDAILRRNQPASQATISNVVDDQQTEEVFLDRGAPVSLRALDQSIVQQKKYPTASPSGKPFLAVYVAGGTISGQINGNGYLYPPMQLFDNCNRIKDAIANAYAKGSDEGPNLDIKQLIGQVDHPGLFEGASVLKSCTMLLDIWSEGSNVNIAFGLMDTSLGRDVYDLIGYGMPVATSMRSRGKKNLKVMSSQDPYWDSNKNKDGEEYLEINPLLIDAFDLVVDPASWTYVQTQQTDSKQGVAIRDAIKRLCADGSRPPCACATVTDTTTEEDKMKEELKAALQTMTPDELKADAAVLYDAVFEAGKKAVVVEPIVDSQRAEVAETALKDAKSELAEANARMLVLQTVVDRVEAERKQMEIERLEADRVSKLEDAIKAKCEGLPWTDARSKYLREFLLKDASKTAADVEEANNKFEDAFGSYMTRPDIEPAPAGKPNKNEMVAVEPSYALDPLGIPVSRVKGAIARS